MKITDKKAEEMTARELAAYIDYAVLKPDLTPDEIIELAKEGTELGCATICINPGYLEMLEPIVKGTDTGLCPVTDFPFGTSTTESKAVQVEIVSKFETVKEVDVVANFGMIRQGMYKEVTADIKACADAAHRYGKELKVIFETDTLTREQIVEACKCAVEAGADYVKTSTGFLTGYNGVGAAPETVKLMLDTVGDRCKVKGSGGIRTYERLCELVNMGVDRVGVGYSSVRKVIGLD
ncbi:MAG: deoxyribose-phosphate aldolase [Clostridia bacterium]|nr:deoxyribose-phosphate aldolase [Clostridia bacterium]